MSPTVVASGVATLSCWFGRLNLESRVPELDDVIAAVLAPYFTLTPGRTEGALDVRITRADRPSVPESDLAAVRRSPQLWLEEEGPRFVVLDHRPDRMVLLRDAEEDSGPMLITVSRPAGSVHLEVYDDEPRTVRALVRYLGSLVGTQLNHGGVPILHGSAVARGGRSVIMLGGSSAGKSTLAFLASTLAGWDFVTDDMLVAWRESAGAPTQVGGWPRRMGISVGSLLGHPARAGFEQTPLRRYGGPVGPLPTPGEASWTRAGRVRVYCDLDEFTTITGASVDQRSRPAAVVLPKADPDCRGWRIEPVEPPIAQVEPITNRNLRYFVDYLGVLPPVPPDSVTRHAVLAELAALPCVRVRYGPDVNRDFAGFWAEVAESVGMTAGAPC